MISETAGFLTSLKVAGDIAKAMIDIRDAEALKVKVREFNAAVIDVQAQAMAAHVAHAHLIERVRELETKIAQLEEWGREKQRYELVEADAGRGSVFVYLIKPDAQAGEPIHAICANCYQNGKKSILQATPRIEMGVRVHACHHCKTEILYRGPNFVARAT